MLAVGAAFLTGYYAQQVNRDPARKRPTWAALLPAFLQTSGYRSYHSGKWHVDGPVLKGGFERSYLVTDFNRDFSPKEHFIDDRPAPLPKPEDHYYVTTAVAEHGAAWLAEHEKAHKGEPFFLYVAFTAPHFPLQAPAEDVARYRDRYQVGWDVIRAWRWNRVRELGIVAGALPPYDTETLPDWNLSEEQLRKRIGPGETGRVGPWDRLNDEQKRFQAAKMAVHAAMVDRMDRGIGLVVDQIKAMGAFDDTLIVFLSDNGASAEQMIRGDGHDPKSEPGSARSFLGVGPGWATASNTPFRLYKVWTHEGGISTPMIAHWPKGIAARGELRHTPAHLVDLAPTFFELAGVATPDSYNGEDRPPLPGHSLVPAFAHDPTIARLHLLQAFRQPRPPQGRLEDRLQRPRRRLGTLQPRRRPHRDAQPRRRPARPRQGPRRDLGTPGPGIPAGGRDGEALEVTRAGVGPTFGGWPPARTTGRIAF